MRISSNQPQINCFAVSHRDFAVLYERHKREVWAFVYDCWQNAHVAEDIMQEAFLRLWKQWNEGEVILNPRAWLFRVARNLGIDYAKSAFRRRGTRPAESLPEVSSKELSSLEKMQAAELREQVQQVVKQLSPRYADVLRLHFWEQRSRKEIASLRGWTVPAVNNLLQRAINRLHELLGDLAPDAADDDLTAAR
jgi:RNA polymerase sigma-70 factor (ECF subfamily)